MVLVSAVVFFASCNKEDAPIFNKSPEERLNEVLSKYQTQLAGAQYGWKGIVYPKAGGIYTFYFKFNNLNRVQMLSSFDSTSAVTFKESSYRLKALQQPSLIFDTYSYIHVLSDPSFDVNGVPGNQGLQSDFEYYFDSSSTDTIKLVGRFNSSKAVLIRATQTEATAFNNGELASGLLLNKLQTYYKRLTIGNVAYDFNFDTRERTVKFTDNTGNLLDSSRISEYYLSLGGITLASPVKIGNQVFSSISKISYNSSSQSITSTINNSTASTITEVVAPLKVDVNAPSRWYNYAASTDDYWFSVEGFQVNGVVDGYGITNISSGNFPYYFLIYYPKWSTSNDLFGPVFLDQTSNSLTIQYATAPRFPTYTTDGKILFRQLGDYGTYPTTGAAAASKSQLYITAGHYLIQTNDDSYDMVSARDGKTWITWYSSK